MLGGPGQRLDRRAGVVEGHFRLTPFKADFGSADARHAVRCGPDFTPPFPSYVSGHAGFCGATFHMLRRLYGDRVPFTFVSDEYNGITRDNDGRVRPRLPRSYANLTQAEEEAGQSRIYLGVHWQFDKTGGQALSHQVVDYVFARGLVRPGAQ